MALSLKDEFELLPKEEQLAILDGLDLEVLEAMAKGSWWWTSRPEQNPPEGDWTVFLYLAGRGAGKALSLVTMIPTDMGWKKMGEIQPGDTVFDERGQPCQVEAVFDRFAEVAYRITFSDGTFIDSCDEHQWATWTHADRKALSRSPNPGSFPKNWASPGQVRTSQQIASTMFHGARGDLNHCVPLCAPIELPEAELPIDPYVLGLWLGDGSSSSSEITTPDTELLEYIHQAGYSTKKIRQPEGKCPRYVVGAKPEVRDHLGRMAPNGSLHSVLREMGLLGNKHIPAAYLRSSEIQRLALLQGLMDSDGTASHKQSSVEFCTIIKELAEQFTELARSLGQKPISKESDAKLYGRITSKRYRITWRPTIDVFRLLRKRDRISFGGSQQLRSKHRMITKIERIDSQPMRCITVDSPNSMYLAGEGFIPTHNTRSGAEWIVQRTIDHPYDTSGFPAERLVMAFSLNDARMVCIEGSSGILRALETRGFEQITDHRHRAEPEGKYHYVRAPKPHIIILETGAKIFFTGADIDSARGFNLSDIWADEIIKWTNPDRVWREGILPALRADVPGDKPRAFFTTTPKPIELLQNWLHEIAQDNPYYSYARGSTFDNASNLSEDFIKEITSIYEGTALGRQELYGEMLEGLEGVLFTYSSIHTNRVDIGPERVAHRTVGVDPGLTGADDGDEMGVVVVCRDHKDHMYVIADETTRSSGRDAALYAWRIFEQYQCDTLVYEENLGKAWMKQVFTDAFLELQRAGVFPVDMMTPPLVPVFSTQGKKLRAEPVAMRYSQGRAHHLGEFPLLEKQMLGFDPIKSKTSPDRLDALVHACRHLMSGEKKASRLITPVGRRIPSLSREW